MSDQEGGRFPAGREEALTVTADREAGLVRIDFGSPVTFLAMPPRETYEFARELVKRARQAAQR